MPFTQKLDTCSNQPYYHVTFWVWLSFRTCAHMQIVMCFSQNVIKLDLFFSFFSKQVAGQLQTLSCPLKKNHQQCEKLWSPQSGFQADHKVGERWGMMEVTNGLHAKAWALSEIRGCLFTLFFFLHGSRCCFRSTSKQPKRVMTCLYPGLVQLTCAQLGCSVSGHICHAPTKRNVS